MKALQLTAWKSDPSLQVVPDPTPGPGQVVIRIAGAGACHSDLHLLHDFDEGLMPWSPPFTLGHENAGWVAALGEGVEGLAEGDAVAVYGSWGCGRCTRCLTGAENYCLRPGAVVPPGGLGSDGGMAPLMLVPEARWLVPLGDLDPVLAAPLTDAGLTPYHAIRRSLGLLVPGSTAVVVGTGGLGHMAVQLLGALSPTTVVAVDQRPAALARAGAAGAAHTASPDEATALVRDLTQGRGAELVLDFVGVDATMALGVTLASTLGHLTVVGIGGGSLGVGFFTVPYEMSVATTYWGTLPELREVIALAAQGRIRPEVQRFSLEDGALAYQAMTDGTLTGRAVVVPD